MVDIEPGETLQQLKDRLFKMFLAELEADMLAEGLLGGVPESDYPLIRLESDDLAEYLFVRNIRMAPAR